MSGALRSAVLALACVATGAPAAGDAEGQAFVQRFRAAAASADPQGLAELAALPFLYQGRSLGREAFVAEAVPGLFTPAVRRCLQRARPQAEDGRLVMWCAPYGFYLGPIGGRWRLVEFATDTP